MQRRFLTVAAVVALTLPALAQDAEVGKEYEITIDAELTNPYTGPFGEANIGSVVVAIPNAKVKERYNVKVTAVRINQYTGNPQASCDFVRIGGDRKGMCIAAP